VRLAVRRLGGKNQDGVINQLKNKGYVFASNDNNQSGNGPFITVRRSWIICNAAVELNTNTFYSIY